MTTSSYIWPRSTSGPVYSTRILFLRPWTTYVKDFLWPCARSVMTTVGVAVRGLRDLDALVPVLENLGARHLGYGVQEAHYDVGGEALLKTLESALGDEWTPAVREAWTQTYGVVKTTMIRGATEFERKNLDA